MVDDAGGNVKRVNKDDLRMMMDLGKWSPSNEKIILAVRDNIIDKCIAKGYDIIVDDTNLHPRMERGIRKLVGKRASVEVMYIDTDLDECLKRNALRTGDAFVPEEFIRDQAAKWEKWKHEDCTTPVNEKGNFTPVEHIEGLPWCVIFDIDGTIAQHTTRSPYEWHRVGEDEVIEGTKHLYEMIEDANITSEDYNPYDHTQVIWFSGRDGVCRDQTLAWLKNHGINADHLYMRAEGDSRKDDIVKSELFDEHILGKYNVKFVVDDRKQVKEMWVERGLFVLDVNQHDLRF